MPSLNIVQFITWYTEPFFRLEFLFLSLWFFSHVLHLHVLRTALGSWAKSPPPSMETLLGTHARKMWCLEVTQLVESAASWEPSNHPSLPSASTTGRRTLTQGRLKLCSSVRLSFARACNPPFLIQFWLDPVLTVLRCLVPVAGFHTCVCTCMIFAFGSSSSVICCVPLLLHRLWF